MPCLFISYRGAVLPSQVFNDLRHDGIYLFVGKGAGNILQIQAYRDAFETFSDALAAIYVEYHEAREQVAGARPHGVEQRLHRHLILNEDREIAAHRRKPRDSGESRHGGLESRLSLDLENERRICQLQPASDLRVQP